MKNTGENYNFLINKIKTEKPSKICHNKLNNQTIKSDYASKFRRMDAKKSSNKPMAPTIKQKLQVSLQVYLKWSQRNDYCVGYLLIRLQLNNSSAKYFLILNKDYNYSYFYKHLILQQRQIYRWEINIFQENTRTTENQNTYSLTKSKIHTDFLHTAMKKIPK